MVRVVISVFFLSFTLLVYADETELRMYRPFTQGVDQAGLQMTAEIQGRCEKQSQLMPRLDAWQCQSEDTVYDPCFKKPGNDHRLYCPQSPWNGDSTVIKADIVINNEPFAEINMAENLPWVVLLSSGGMCLRTLKKEMFDQQPVEYWCQDKTFLFGRLQRCRSVWSMLRYDNGHTDYVNIRQAWF